MKKSILLFILLAIVAHSNAQRKFSIGIGLNYPIGLERHGYEENRIGYYLDGCYRINDKLDIDLSVSAEGYTSVFRDYEWGTTVYDCSSLAIVAGLNRSFALKTQAVKPYIGIGLGSSLDNMGTGVFNEGMRCHLTLVPKAGVLLVKHIHVFAKYYITHPDFQRFIVGLGYRF